MGFRARKVRIAARQKGDDRLAHMPPELLAALANIPGERTGKVFEFKSRGDIKTQLAGTIRRAGIKVLWPHARRHGFATGLLDKGVNPVTVAKRGGWKNARHAFETYGHDVAPADATDVPTGTP